MNYQSESSTSKQIIINRTENVKSNSKNYRVGVSTILQATQSKVNKAKLLKWRNSKGNSQANLISQSAKIRGQLFHLVIAKYLKNESFTCPTTIQPYFDRVLPVLEELENIKLVEAPIYNIILDYKGIVDCVAEYQNQMCVIEFESANRIKPLYDKPIQIASYMDAINQQYNWNITNGLLVRATMKEIDVTFFHSDEMIIYLQKWRDRVAQFKAN